MHTTCTPVRARRFAVSGFGLRAFLGSALAVWRQRRDLSCLPVERLNDLGLTESEARIEAEKPIWNVPAHWRR